MDEGVRLPNNYLGVYPLGSPTNIYLCCLVYGQGRHKESFRLINASKILEFHGDL